MALFSVTSELLLIDENASIEMTSLVEDILLEVSPEGTFEDTGAIDDDRLDRGGIITSSELVTTFAVLLVSFKNLLLPLPTMCAVTP